MYEGGKMSNRIKGFAFVALIFLMCQKTNVSQLLGEYQLIENETYTVEQAISRKLLRGWKSYELKDQIDKALRLRQKQIRICDKLKTMVVEPCTVIVSDEEGYTNTMILTPQNITDMKHNANKVIKLLENTLLHL